MSAPSILSATAVLALLGCSALLGGCGSTRDPAAVSGSQVLPWMSIIGPDWQRSASKLEFGDTVVWYHGSAMGDYVDGKNGWIGRVQGQVVAETRVAGRQSLIFSEMLDFHPNDVIRSNGGVTRTTDDRLGDWIERRVTGPTPSAVPLPPPAPVHRGPSATNPVMPVAEPAPQPPPPPAKPAWKRWLWPF